MIIITGHMPDVSNHATKDSVITMNYAIKKQKAGISMSNICHACGRTIPQLNGETIGDFLSEHVGNGKRMSVLQLSERLGVTRAAIYNWLRNINSPKPHILPLIGRKLGLEKELNKFIKTKAIKRKISERWDVN